ncbi:MAG: hypothetical protein KDC23_01190 [Actinobacteria bacterium]|nr:hypothetical protein [Actinomycetota bacterium]
MSADDSRLDPSAAAALSQLRRTAEWLRSLPLRRLTEEHSPVAGGARLLVTRVDELTRVVCADSPHCEECPPGSVRPPAVDSSVLGVQLAAHSDQLARVLLVCGPRSQPALSEGLTELAAAALELRRG